MNRWRVKLVYGLIAALVGGHLFDILSGREHWPFSNYPMYSNARRSHSLSALLPYGVTEEEPPREIAFLVPEYIDPFGRGRLRAALGRLHSSADREYRLSKALDDLLGRYDARRLAGLHDGPPLRGIRLYRAVWRIDPWARNADRPDRRDLLFDYPRPSGSART